MAGLHADSLFTNIPLDETTDIGIDSLYNDNQNTRKISKDSFCKFLNVVTKKCFLFNNRIYKQIDGMATGSPMGPALDNIFMCSFENKWLKDCSHRLKPVFHRRYVEDIFVLFFSLNHA